MKCSHGTIMTIVEELEESMSMAVGSTEELRDGGEPYRCVRRATATGVTEGNQAGPNKRSTRLVVSGRGL